MIGAEVLMCFCPNKIIQVLKCNSQYAGEKQNAPEVEDAKRTSVCYIVVLHDIENHKLKQI